MKNNVCLYNGTIFTGSKFIDNGAVLIENNKIARVFGENEFRKNALNQKTEYVNLDGSYAVPGFIDSHIHGLEGNSVCGGESANILKISQALLKYGTTAFIPTLGTDTPENLLKNVKIIAEAMGKENGAKILGAHLEGPFLSKIKAGGMPVEKIIPADLDLLKKLWQTSKNSIINITIAPEICDISRLVSFCKSKGIILQIGHTNATYEQTQDAFKQGITHATHMFNAMTGFHHREAGVVGAILENDNASCELIADGYHVTPAAIRVLVKCKPSSQIVLVSDAQKYTKSKIKSYKEGKHEIILGDFFYRKHDKVMTGGNISMIDSVKNMVSFGIGLDSALKMASTNPAKILGLKNRGKISKGYFADIAILDKKLNIEATIADGKRYVV